VRILVRVCLRAHACREKAESKSRAYVRMCGVEEIACTRAREKEQTCHCAHMHKCVIGCTIICVVTRQHLLFIICSIHKQHPHHTNTHYYVHTPAIHTHNICSISDTCTHHNYQLLHAHAMTVVYTGQHLLSAHTQTRRNPDTHLLFVLLAVNQRCLTVGQFL